MQWIIAPLEDLDGGPIRWEDVCGLDCIARLLLRKGFASADEVRNFLEPRLKSLSDPFLLPQMREAVARILRALDRSERIVLFGDYDVDGITSLALLAETLRAYGAKPDLFLPLRLEEGYGMSRESVNRCCEKHSPQLVIALDCGTSSVTEVARLRERGVEVIILDHHEPKSALPECVALVNPKIEAGSAFPYLCSVGIVFKLCHALLKTRPLPEFDLKSKLDLVALGTVADIVPLEGENRILVQRGSVEIGRTKRIGLRKLIELSGVRPPILPEHIGFRLGPRLNAAGRLSNAEKALRLLLTNDAKEAADLAQELDRENRDRQEVERQICGAAAEKLAKTFNSSDAAIVVAERGWHPGVLGIAAARIMRKYHRPTLVIGIEENGVGKGSGRSIEGFSLVQGLRRCERWLDQYGGHEMAAGLSLSEGNLERFTEAFKAAAREMLSDDQLQPRLRVDHEIAFSDVNFNLLRWHELLQPFGNGNPQPLFFARGAEPAAPPRVLKERHLSLQLRQKNHRLRAIYFGSAADELPPPPWDVAFRISAGEYEGQPRLEIQVQALRSSKPA